MNGVNGIFLLRWTDEEGYVPTGMFFQEGDASRVESLALRIGMSHEPAKEFSTLPTQDTLIVSWMQKFKDAKRKTQKIIVGVEILPSEKPDDVKSFLVEAARQLQDHVADPREQVDQLLCAIFASRVAPEQGSDVEEDLQSRIVNRAQQMIGKDQIDEAQVLLEKAKVIPQQIQRLVDKGVKLLKQQKLDEAKKVYDEAIAMAREIHEDELATRLADDYKRVSDRPKVIERVRDLEAKALQALREGNYKRASELFRDAGKEVARLNDVDAMNEFSKKAQLMFEFHTVDKAKKRSF